MRHQSSTVCQFHPPRMTKHQSEGRATRGAEQPHNQSHSSCCLSHNGFSQNGYGAGDVDAGDTDEGDDNDGDADADDGDNEDYGHDGGVAGVSWLMAGMAGLGWRGAEFVPETQGLGRGNVGEVQDTFMDDVFSQVGCRLLSILMKIELPKIIKAGVSIKHGASRSA